MSRKSARCEETLAESPTRSTSEGLTDIEQRGYRGRRFDFKGYGMDIPYNTLCAANTRRAEKESLKFKIALHDLCDASEHVFMPYLHTELCIKFSLRRRPPSFLGYLNLHLDNVDLQASTTGTAAGSSRRRLSDFFYLKVPCCSIMLDALLSKKPFTRGLVK